MQQTVGLPLVVPDGALERDGATAPNERTAMGLKTRRILTCMLGLVAMTVSACEHSAAGEPRAPGAIANPFFAFDNGTGRDVLSPEEQARMLKELGYDGIGYTGTKGIPEMLAALDKYGLKMFSTYVRVDVGSEQPGYDPGLPAAIEQLKGRDTVIWLYVIGKGPKAEEQTIRLVREVADMAARSDLRVATYPHTGFHVGRVEDSVRIARKVDRSNVGVSFNLCHWLKVDGEQLDRRLKEAMPYLYLVSINGADDGETRTMSWNRLIQALDRGTYDVAGFVRNLHRLGYHGPVGLQCYKVPGDRRKNLRSSIEAWRKIWRSLEAPVKKR